MGDQNLFVIYLKHVNETAALPDHKLRIINENHRNNVIFLRLNHTFQIKRLHVKNVQVSAVTANSYQFNVRCCRHVEHRMIFSFKSFYIFKISETICKNTPFCRTNNQIFKPDRLNKVNLIFYFFQGKALFTTKHRLKKFETFLNIRVWWWFLNFFWRFFLSVIIWQNWGYLATVWTYRIFISRHWWPWSRRSIAWTYRVRSERTVSSLGIFFGWT